MTYITRDDGERFVIPSYRDTITAKQKTSLKSEILALSKSYGEYITLQRKTPTKYEVAFSTDRGYLLGESVWNYFKQPIDMVYCEAIPGTTEAILVIVKAGSVYLDGSFPVDSIPEELVVFLTEQNNFEIYIYGDVPISSTPEDGKFSFDAASVKSFNVLDKPAFPTLPLLSAYRFDLVDTVLKSHGIGVLPIKPIIAIIAFVIIGWAAWSYISKSMEETAPPPPPPPKPNPYQGYYDALSTFAPDEQIDVFIKELNILLTMPGWYVKNLNYVNGVMVANVQSPGSKLDNLFTWAKINNANVNLQKNGVVVTIALPLVKRSRPENIYQFKRVLASLIDRLATVYPGNNLRIGNFTNKGSYWTITVSIRLNKITPTVLGLIGQQMKDYPITLQNISTSVNNGVVTGTINLTVLGN